MRFRLADTYTWAKGLGCGFTQRSCLEFMRSRRIPRKEAGVEADASLAPFCTKRGPVQPSGEVRKAEEGCRREAATPFCNLVIAPNGPDSVIHYSTPVLLLLLQVRHPAPLKPEYRHIEGENEGEEGRWDSCS